MQPLMFEMIPFFLKRDVLWRELSLQIVGNWPQTGQNGAQDRGLLRACSDLDGPQDLGAALH